MLLGPAAAARVACAPMPATSPRVSPFCAGNAERCLARTFDRIERFDWRYAHLLDATHSALGVPGEEFLVAYVRTLPFVCSAVAAGQLPETFFDELAALALDEIKRTGTFRMSRCDVYECRMG